MIENDIKIIRKTQRVAKSTMAKEIKNISQRQTNHEKANTKQFSTIFSAISLLPTQDVITKTIQDTIKITVNGKIDGIKSDVNTLTSKVDMVGEHLKQQDVALETLSNKIKPIDGAREWLSDTGKVILYIGAIALAVAGIIEVLQLIHVIK